MLQLHFMHDSPLPLFRHAPGLRHALPHVGLGTFPTPLETASVAGRQILVKRDDLCSADYGGNKVRKLEFLLGDAQRKGAGRIVTAGATGSHHAFATAWHGSRLGFPCSLVLFPQRRTAHVREMLLLMAAAGAELRWVRRMEAVPFGLWRARLVHRAERPCLVPPGGSSAIGALGYVNAGLELAEQLGTATRRPSVIHMAAGTLGTAAGLAVGLAWAGCPIPILATRITSRLVTNERALGSLVRDTVQLLGAAGAQPPDAESALRLVRLNHDQIGTGYGHATEAGNDATAVFADAGLVLDPTYTAKAAAALLADQARDPGGLPLFWHTLSASVPVALSGRIEEPATLDMLPRRFGEYLERPV
jgi:D-cysteine desulfhydrase